MRIGPVDGGFLDSQMSQKLQHRLDCCWVRKISNGTCPSPATQAGEGLAQLLAH